MRILVFGDSIANGFYDPEGGWVDRLRKYFLGKTVAENNDDHPNVFNLGISGDFTKNILERFEVETKARQWPGEEFVFVFATGTNDTLYRGEEYQSTPEQYENELKQLVEKAKKFSDNILFVSLFPVVDKLLQPAPFTTTGKCYSTERLKLFNDVLIKVRSENNLLMADLWTPFSEKDLESLFFDGLHPNEKGHELIFEKVKPMIEEFLK